MNPTVGAFLNVLFERIPSWVELLKKNKHGDRLLEKLEDILLGLQIERSDAENKQASDPLVRKWLNKLQRAVDDDENLLEEVNYEALRLKVEGQLRNLEEKSNQQKKSTKKNEEGEKKKKEGGEENKKDGGNLTAILKSCQCEGCVSTVVKAIRSIGGVEKVMCDVDSKKLTVIGKVDPVMLREEVERKTQKNVEVVSPITKKDGKGKKGGDNGSDNGAGEEKKKMQKQNKEKDSRENTGGEDKKTKEKELPITTAVLKLHCHCQGCIQKIDEIVTKFKGSMDMKVLAETLKKDLKKEIEIVPRKKEGGEKKEKGGGDNGGGGGKGKGKGREDNVEGKGKVKDEIDGGVGAGVGAMEQTLIISSYLLVLPDSQLVDILSGKGIVVPITSKTTAKKKKGDRRITLQITLNIQQISEMEIGLAVGGAFLSSALNVIFDRIAPHDCAKNKKASNPLVRKWLNKLQRAMDGAESLLEEVNYEALRRKVEDRLRNLAETSNQQVSDLNLSLSDDYFIYIEEKLEDTIKKLEVLEKQIGRLGLQKHFDSEGAMGSKIIVTTRKENVARMMDSGAINVGTLSSEASWALFKRHSLKNRDPEEHPEL
ncbi:hypothetical protein T459_34800 [Capsicum annuum]|uniref:HMA domain-containing protein n=1 Tax=Capsicum annuum TaxID=4072 RepID=A0A2G2XV38_CAPAN|nr:hypothetical protein T459_34800 [Capsicum annuum]